MKFDELAKLYQESEDFGKMPFAEWCYKYGIEKYCQALCEHMEGEKFSKEMLIVYFKNIAERLKGEKNE